MAYLDRIDMQMAQIRGGLEAGIDALVYTDPEFDHKRMEQIRLALEADKN